MALKITTVLENTQGEHKALIFEHGLCFHVEKDGHKLLFDLGQSDALLHNATELGITLHDLEYVVLSHGHYDHTGGLRALSTVARDFSLVVGRGFFREKYARRNHALDFLGNNFDEAWLRERKIACEAMTDQIREILPGVHVITGFQRKHEDEKVNPRFVLREGEGFVPDTFSDEVMLAIETPKGLVALLGCSHPGVKNLLDTALELLQRPLYAVIGGTHLVEGSDRSLELTKQYFLDKDVKVIGVSHCTGQNGMQCLSVLEDRYFHNCTGSSLFVE